MSVVAAVETFVSQVSTGVGVLLGLNYYSLVWAGVGACIPLTKTKKFGFWSIGYVLFSALLGALIATFASDLLDVKQRSTTLMMAVIGGASWQTIIAAAIRSTEENLGQFLKAFFALFHKRPPDDKPPDDKP